MGIKPRTARPCAICQKNRVEKTKVCEDCMTKFQNQIGQPWFQFAIEESDRTARLIRNARRHEVAIDVVQLNNES